MSTAETVLNAHRFDQLSHVFGMAGTYTNGMPSSCAGVRGEAPLGFTTATTAASPARERKGGMVMVQTTKILIYY